MESSSNYESEEDDVCHDSDNKGSMPILGFNFIYFKHEP